MFFAKKCGLLAVSHTDGGAGGLCLGLEAVGLRLRHAFAAAAGTAP